MDTERNKNSAPFIKYFKDIGKIIFTQKSALGKRYLFQVKSEMAINKCFSFLTSFGIDKRVTAGSRKLAKLRSWVRRTAREFSGWALFY